MITETSSWSPMAMRTSAMSPSFSIATIVPRRRLRADRPRASSRGGRRWLFPRSELERLLVRPFGMPRPPREDALGLSARNRLRGTIVAIEKDGLMAEVRIAIGDQELVSVITRSSAERLGLAVGDDAFAVIKATEIMIGKESA